jgi:Asp-tRNA(Asn)/Glu-tRNA(Gln) amidotransferase A subunit family amidase
MEDSLRWSSAIETRDAILRREVSAVDVLTRCLARIRSLDPHHKAFVSLDAKVGLTAAEELDAALARGEQAGPLHGVPVAVKDDLWVAGMPATCGSLLFANFTPSRDGLVAERLRAAGAVIVGKTNLSEFAAWPRTRSLVGGETVNPLDPIRIPGASSGGSSAAVASGMVPLAIGTDGGGSVRIPSALTGLVGLFPTVGSVPSRGSFRCSPTESAGPMARNVADVALTHQVIAGHEGEVDTLLFASGREAIDGLTGGVSGLRIGWSDDFGWIEPDALIVGLARAAVEALASRGASVGEIGERVEHPWGDGSAMASLHEAVRTVTHPTTQGAAPELAGAEQWLSRSVGAGELIYAAPEFRALLASHSHLLTPPFRASLQHPPDPAAMPDEREVRDSFMRLLQRYDVICSPTMATIAPAIPQSWRSPYDDYFMGTHYTFIANTARCPAVTVPCGSKDGLPAGLQIIGKPGEEQLILRVAQAVENAIGVFSLAGAGAGFAF